MMGRGGKAAIVLVMWSLATMGATGTGVRPVSAEEISVELNDAQAIRHALEAQTGKRVKLKLISGQDLEGKVAKLGAQAVVLSDLAGMEFFDATVRLDQVAAVIVRVRTK